MVSKENDMYKVLIVDDEKELAEILGEYLKLEGFDTYIAYDGEEGIRLFKSTLPELAILDIMLPKKNGIEVCKAIREVSDAVVMMLSAKNGEMDKVICLGAGADDYITKPFSPVELVARVKAHARRYSGSTSPESKSHTGNKPDSENQLYAEDKVHLGNQSPAEEKINESSQEMASLQAGLIHAGRLELNEAAYEARFDGKLLELTTREFEMLVFFASNRNQVFSKEQIYEHIWGLNEYGDIGTVAVYIRKLRSKFEVFGCDYIKTIWGVGYKFVID